MLREDAIKKHRAMWNWIAEQIEKYQRTMNIDILKAYFLKQQGDDTLDMQLYENCYLCCYTTVVCKNCPLLWPSESDSLMCLYSDKITDGDKTTGGYNKGLYVECYMLADGYDWQLQASLCRKIANLPERETSK